MQKIIRAFDAVGSVRRRVCNPTGKRNLEIKKSRNDARIKGFPIYGAITQRESATLAVWKSWVQIPLAPPVTINHKAKKRFVVFYTLIYKDRTLDKNSINMIIIEIKKVSAYDLFIR